MLRTHRLGDGNVPEPNHTNTTPISPGTENESISYHRKTKPFILDDDGVSTALPYRGA